MDLAELFSPQVLIVVGKGGVGKTTLSAALGLLAARHGRRVLIVEVEQKGTLPAMFGVPALRYEETELAEGLWARTLTPEEALVQYFEDHNMGRLSRRLARSNVIDYVATAIPGLKDIIVLGRVKAIANEGRFDTLIVDSPAAGHAVVFLTGGKGILDAVRVGPIREQAREVLALLEDPGRCRVPLVTLAEETPVNETAETAARLRDKLEIRLGPAVVNSWVGGAVEPVPSAADIERLATEAGVRVDERVISALHAAARFRAARHGLQDEQLARLREKVDGPILLLPYCFSAAFGREELETLVGVLQGQLAPEAAA